MDIERCKKLVASIQHLESTEIEELFKLLHSNKCEYTRNNNGIFVNLSWLSEGLLSCIETYVAFCNKSQTEVRKYESLCDVLNKNMHEQKHLEKNAISQSNAIYSDVSKNDKKQSAPKVSSSMKFYLLKKKFAKQYPITSNAKSDLKNEINVM